MMILWGSTVASKKLMSTEASTRNNKEVELSYNGIQLTSMFVLISECHKTE